MQHTIDIPTGLQPGWEVEDPQFNAGDGELRTISESFVILQSLRQSRNKWIASMFPKFSSKARGKATEVVPPPHTIKAHGKYDLRVGPHVFSNTAVYEVHYLPEVDSTGGKDVQSTPGPATARPTTTSVPSQTSHNFSSLSHVTPALTAQVALASQSNPILANLLHAVVNRTATDDQVKTLGLLIQSLEGVQQLEPPQIPPYDTPTGTARSGSPKPFDIVIEFHERPTDRWIFPRGNAVCERVGEADRALSQSDVLITTCLSPVSTSSSNVSDPAEQPTAEPISEVVSFRLSKVSQAFWELLVHWTGGPDKMQETRAKLADMVKDKPPRSYLPYRLPEGELLADLRSAVAPPYTMKSIKPPGADSTRSKRKSVSRKATLVSNGPVTPAEKPPPKRRQSLKAKPTLPLLIACRACGQTDVPLMMGGRYCRVCIDAGRAVADIPEVAPRTASSNPSSSWKMNSMPPGASPPQDAIASTATPTQPITHPSGSTVNSVIGTSSIPHNAHTPGS